MKQYLKLMQFIIKNGVPKNDRTGIGTISIFGYRMNFNLKNGFPLLTTKECNFQLIVHELLWFLSGSTNIKYLEKNKVRIWSKWADNKGDLGPIYGKQWRHWDTYDGNYIDQIDNIIKQLKNNPNSRRMIVSSWNVGELNKMSLAPCHVLFQFYVANNTISCQLYQRSCDVFIGLPFNIASYSLLLKMIADQCNLKVGNLIWIGGDTHIYKNHIDQVYLQLKRIPRPLPQLSIKRRVKSLFEYKYDDFVIKNYDPYPHITAPIAV